MVFARKTDDHLASLAKQLDQLVADHEDKQLRAVIHLIGEDKAALEEAAKSFSQTAGLKKVPMTVPNEFENGPANWGINPQAALTVFMYEKKTVVSNHAFTENGLDGQAVETIISAVPNLLN